MTSASDGQEASPFDPHARYTHCNGLVYQDFARYLLGEPDPKDRANANIARYLREGRSEAFCRVFREGYDDHLARIGGPGAPDREAVAGFHAEGHAHGYARATDPFQEPTDAVSAGRDRAVAFEKGLARSAGAGLAAAFHGRRPEEVADTPHNRARTEGFARATKSHGDYHES